MPRLKDLCKSITEMSLEEATTLVRRLRQARRDYIPPKKRIEVSELEDEDAAPKKRRTTRSKPSTKGSSLLEKLTKLSPSEMQKLKESLK